MKMINKRKKAIVIVVLVFILLLICKIVLEYLYYKGILFPSYAIFKEKTIVVNDYDDIKNDSNEFDDINFNKALRKLELKNKKLSAFTDNDKVLWESDIGYKVQDFLWCDIDRDDEKELVLLAWRAGRYGSFLPFWIKENDLSFDQHIFIYKFKNSTFKSIWKSSYIEVDVREFYFDNEYKILTLLDKSYCRNRFAWFSWGLNSIKASKLDYDEKNDKVLGKLNLISVGDNLIHKQIYEQGNKNNRNYDFLYKNIKNYISKGNLKTINQETIFVDDEKEYSDFPNFGTPIEVGEAIKNAGFNLVTLANNHILDKNEKGIEITKKFYNDNDINYIGLRENGKNYKILDIEGLKVSVFNYTYGINMMTNDQVLKTNVNSLIDEKQVKRDLDEGVSKGDISIVFVHWGEENNNKITELQKHFAKIFLSKGVDIVIGTHPHILQKYELLKDGTGNEMLIYYSLGNIVSYQKDMENLIGGIADVEVLKTNNGIKFKSYILVPTWTAKNEEYVTTYLLSEYEDNITNKKEKIKTIEMLLNPIDKNEILSKIKRVKPVSEYEIKTIDKEGYNQKKKNSNIDVKNYDIINNVETISFGRYEQDNNIENGKEPIEWIIMAKKDGKAYLTSKYILDYIEFDKTNDENKEIKGIRYQDTYMYHQIFKSFIPTAFTDEEIELVHNKSVTLACNYRYNSIGFDYTNPYYMTAEETEFAKSKYRGESTNEYWILNKCDTFNKLDITTNREKFVMADGNIAYNGFRNEKEKNELEGATNIYEVKGFRPFIIIDY